MASPVSPSLLEGADSEPAGFVVRQNANLAFGPAFPAAEMQDAHNIVEGNAWIAPASRYQYPFTVEQDWFFNPVTARVYSSPEGYAVDVPPAARRIAFVAFRFQDADGVQEWHQEDHRLLCRLLCAHLLGCPPVDEPDAEEVARRARLAAENAAEEAAVDARRRYNTDVWVRVVAPGTGYRGTSFVLVGTLQDMEHRHYEETGPEDDALFVPNLVGLRTAEQLCNGRSITNEQLLRLIRIREDLEYEYDAPYGEDPDTIRRLKAEETRILRAVEGAFRSHRAIFASLASHGAAVASGVFRAARAHARRRAALYAFGSVN